MQLNQPINIYNASSKKVGIVVARFNRDITDRLLVSARKILDKHQVKPENITVISVAGSAEIPYALQKLAMMKKYDCLVALGCIIRGETPHFDYVCKMAQEGILRVSLDNHIPIGFGILTVNTLDQALDRTNAGAGAVAAALDLVRE